MFPWGIMEKILQSYSEEESVNLSNSHKRMYTGYFSCEFILHIGSRSDVIPRAWWVVTSILFWDASFGNPSQFLSGEAKLQPYCVCHHCWIEHYNLRLARQKNSAGNILNISGKRSSALAVFFVASFFLSSELSLYIFREWMLAVSTLSHAGFSAPVCRKSSLKDAPLESNVSSAVPSVYNNWMPRVIEKIFFVPLSNWRWNYQWILQIRHFGSRSTIMIHPGDSNLVS